MHALNNTNRAYADFNSNTISASQWAALEQYGAVFLPAAGCQYETFQGTSVDNEGTDGTYWSASHSDGHDAYCVFFFDAFLDSESYFYRYNGHSVRLVRSAQ